MATATRRAKKSAAKDPDQNIDPDDSALETLLEALKDSDKSLGELRRGHDLSPELVVRLMARYPKLLEEDPISEKVKLRDGITTTIAGTHRSTCWNWKTKGLAYLDDPAARPEDERYARFVERCEEAELASKVLLVDQISRDPDWRAKAWILKARFPKEFTEFTRQELSGPEGSPVALNVTNQPFQVIFSMPKPDATEEWKIIDHRQPEEIEPEPQRASERPAPQFINGHRVSEPIAPPEDQSANISKFDPLGLRGYEKGIK